MVEQEVSREKLDKEEEEMRRIGEEKGRGKKRKRYRKQSRTLPGCRQPAQPS